MKNLIIQKGTDTPFVSLDPANNVFDFKGDSYSQDPNEFYAPIIEWFQEFLSQNKRPITVNFHFTYFNTPTYRPMMEILQMLEQHHVTKKIPLSINWYANTQDVDMMNDAKFLDSNFDHLDIKILPA
ncbi:MAG TPA: hypothetical protein DCS93_37545 [Microscillaceae bacterium]|nr:hypothetical protein [Microscillaceae bacterium]